MYIRYFNINVVGGSFLNRMTYIYIYISVLVGKTFPVEFVNFPYTKIESGIETKVVLTVV